MRAGKDIYYSLDLLDHGEGINGFTNVNTIVKEYEDSIKRVYQSNIGFSEKHNEYFFEEFNNTKNPSVILEEDMFGKEKVWLKSCATTDRLLSKLEKDNVLSKKLKKEIVENAILTTYKEKNIEQELINNLSDADKSLVAEYVAGGKLANKFMSLVEKTNPTYLVDAGKCFIHINQKELNEFKQDLEKDLQRVITTKNLLLKKTVSDNNSIEKQTPSRKNVRKIV